MKEEMKKHVTNVCNTACGIDLWYIDGEGYVTCDGRRFTDEEMTSGPLVYLFRFQTDKVIEILTEIKEEVEQNALPEEEIMELVYRRMPV